MRRLTRVSIVMAGSAALIGSMALPAFAAPTDPTDLSVEVNGGDLSIDGGTAPAGAILDPGQMANFALADVTVTDTRAGVEGWTASVFMSPFESLATGTLVPASALYTPGEAALTGTSTVEEAAAGVSVLGATDLGTAVAVQTATVVTGNNTAIWGADLAIQVPAQALADVYTATLTHSVL